MSRTDQTPDASMEEILASIRRIISEEPGFDRKPQPPKPAVLRQEPAGLARPQASFADDIARALHADTATVEAPPEDDDILELTLEAPVPEPVKPAPRSESGLRLAASRPNLAPAARSEPTLEVPPFQAAPPPVTNGLARLSIPTAAAPPPVDNALLYAPQPAVQVQPEAEPVADVVGDLYERSGFAETVPDIAAVLETADARPAEPAKAEAPIAAAAQEPAGEASGTTGASTLLGVSAASAQSVAPAMPVTAGTSLEDAIAAMLRPMLMDWLDKNMPRIVEKALASELRARGVGGPPTT